MPAPRIVLLDGSVPIHTMAPFAEFLAALGYPAERLRDPATAPRRPPARSPPTCWRVGSPATTSARRWCRC